MSSGWDKYREDINNEWLLETPYNALKCITDAKLERYELLENRKLSLEEREKMGFEVILLSPLIMDKHYDRLSNSSNPAGGYSSVKFCLEDGTRPEYPVYGIYNECYVYDFYKFKEYNNFLDFSFKKFFDILGHDVIPNAYRGLIVPEIEKGARIMDRKYFVQEYELIRRMVFISRSKHTSSYNYDSRAWEHNSPYLYDIYFNNATKNTVARYENHEKYFNSEVERLKNEEERFTLPNRYGFGIEYQFSFDVRKNEYRGYYSRSIANPCCRVGMIPIKKVKCIIVNKYGGLKFLYKYKDTNKSKEYVYRDFGSFILNDGTLLNKENNIFITFDDFIDSTDTIEDINNKIIRRNDLYDLFFPILKEPSKSEFKDYKDYLDNIIPNPPAKDGYYKVTIENDLYSGNFVHAYDPNEGKTVLIDSYDIGCYDYLAGGELEFDDDGLYSSGDSSSDANEEKDTTDNIETNTNTES